MFNLFLGYVCVIPMAKKCCYDSRDLQPICVGKANYNNNKKKQGSVQCKRKWIVKTLGAMLDSQTKDLEHKLNLKLTQDINLHSDSIAQQLIGEAEDKLDVYTP